MIHKFRKRPVLVEAVCLLWSNWEDVCELANVGYFEDGHPEGCYVDASGDITGDSNGRIGLRIPTAEGTVLAVEGDWIVRDGMGELSVYKPDVFGSTYEPVLLLDPVLEAFMRFLAK